MTRSTKSYFRAPTPEEVIAAREDARARQDAERERMYGPVTRQPRATAEELMAQIMLDDRPRVVPIRESAWVSDVPCVGSDDSLAATITASIVCEQRRKKCS
jgi:hypothetical protein